MSTTKIGWYSIAVSILCTLPVELLHTQEIYYSNGLPFQKITLEDGLPINGANEIVQDSIGFLWFGTFNGLTRYDGKNFKHYQSHSQDSNGLASNDIMKLFVDSRNGLWLGTMSKGLQHFDPRTETFTAFPLYSKDGKGISCRSIRDIEEDAYGNIWVATTSGLNKLTPKGNQFDIQSYFAPFYPESLYRLIDSIRSEANTLKAFTRVGNEQWLTDTFRVDRTTKVLLFAMGEYDGISGMVDYGWLKDEAGEVVWKLSFKESFQAGNRAHRFISPFNRV